MGEETPMYNARHRVGSHACGACCLEGWWGSEGSCLWALPRERGPGCQVPGPVLGVFKTHLSEALITVEPVLKPKHQ